MVVVSLPQPDAPENPGPMSKGQRVHVPLGGSVYWAPENTFHTGLPRVEMVQIRLQEVRFFPLGVVKGRSPQPPKGTPACLRVRMPAWT